jgi:AraC-like DNA-binding protein
MSKHTESSLFIFSSSFRQAGEFYQHLISGITTYQELAERVVKQIELACAFRQVERVRELARILLNVPIKEYQLTAQYYLVWCQCRELKYHDEVLERIIEQSQTCKTKALFSRGAFEWYKGKSEAALYFYMEALKTSPNISEYVELVRSIAVLKGTEGFHKSAIRDLERVLPIIRHAEPRLYYDFLNSYAVELMENHRLSEAQDTALIAVSSPFGPFYPEWQKTLSDVRSKQKRRSTVTISRPQIQVDEQEYQPESDDQENIIRSARIQIVIDYMQANLGQKITLAELARLIGLSTSSPSYFINMFKAEIGIPPGEYLMRLRIQKAAHLLATTFLSVKEISIQTGFSYLNRNFQKYFRRYYGMAPLEYRRHAMASQQKKRPAKVVQFPTKRMEYEQGPKLLWDTIKSVLGDRITDEQIARVCGKYYGTLKERRSRTSPDHGEQGRR